MIQPSLQGFYEVRLGRFVYYEIVLDEKEILLVYIGETYQGWMFRYDPNVFREEVLGDDDYPALKARERSITIPHTSIEMYKVKPASFFVRPCFRLHYFDDSPKARRIELGLYHKSRDVDLSILTNYQKEHCL